LNDRILGRVKKIRIAVVGSGISGLSCAWLLSQRHEVTLIEADSRVGGHANTVDVTAEGRTSAVDTGFIVSNTWTYPNFSALMDYLDVTMVSTPMTFAVSAEQGRYEYCGNHLGTLFGTPRQWLSPRHWRMVTDLVRFYTTAEAKAKSVPPDVTLGQFLHAEGYGETFMRRHILPMAGAIWSATPDEIARYPLQAFVSFFSNHKLFLLGSRPDWRTVKGGAREYVNKLVEDSRFALRVSTPVRSIRRHSLGVDIQYVSGRAETFDEVVIATHADQALALLADPTIEETRLLSPFKTSGNRAYLHRDAALMPKTRRFWSGWNYLASEQGDETSPAVTYWMNALQQLDTPVQHFVTLNPVHKPAPHMLDGTFDYRHPIFNTATRAAQDELWSLQGVRRTWFAGAWFGAGFHEDGAQAGLAVAEQLGDLPRPWTVPEPSGRIHVRRPHVPTEPPVVLAAE
jgi:uncharacterized protein